MDMGESAHDLPADSPMSRTLSVSARGRSLRATIATIFAATSALTSAAACSSDPSSPDEASAEAREMFARYVAIGTSNSQGVQSAGIIAESQRASWPAQLAERVGVAFSLPLVQTPGCGPPLRAPLATGLQSLGSGGDLIGGLVGTCAPLQPEVRLPVNNVAIAGATARSALTATPESERAGNVRRGELYSRVLLPGQTQVTAMVAQNPTFVSVELASNEVLAASNGLLASMTPYAEWERDYDRVVDAVRSTGARAVLVGLPNDAANFPSIRRAGEIYDERGPLRLLGIDVADDCARSTNHVYVAGYLLTLLVRTPSTATCADVAGAADFVLTASDIAAINAQMARMNAHMQSKAAEYGYAYFSIETLYGRAKPRFSVNDVLLSNSPFGPLFSLDGVHPNASGQTVLATAAARAIGENYGVEIP